jgi:hypothetical protein
LATKLALVWARATLGGDRSKGSTPLGTLRRHIGTSALGNKVVIAPPSPGLTERLRVKVIRARIHLAVSIAATGFKSFATRSMASLMSVAETTTPGLLNLNSRFILGAVCPRSGGPVQLELHLGIRR